MNIEPVKIALEQIKNNPVLHEEIINELYRNNSLSHLRLLEVYILSNPFKGQDDAEDYIERKIIEIEKENYLKKEQLDLDVLSKKRQIKWFYPILIGSFVSGAFSIVSILSQMKIITLPTFAKSTSTKKETNDLTQHHSNKTDSTDTTTTSIQRLTK